MVAARGLKAVPPVGTKVRLTAYFLRATGQQKGSEGMGRWTTVACKAGLKEAPAADGTMGKPNGWISTGEPCDFCKGGTHVAVNEKLDTSTGYEDLTVEQRGAMYRHFAIGNLEIVGAPPKAADYESPVTYPARDR